MFEFIKAEYIWLAPAIAAALVSVLNAVTRHYTLSSGWRKAIGMAIELLSVIPSRGASVGGPLGKLKLPGHNVKPEVEK